MTATGQRESWETTSPEATLALGAALGRCLVGGLTIGLVGPLGAGKTQLVKGIAAGNAVDDVGKVTSPTFTLVHEYPGRLRLHHVDVYRLRGAQDLIALGFEELIRPDTAVVVEWADRVRSVIPDEALWIELTMTGDAGRRLLFSAVDNAATRCLNHLRSEYR